MLFFISQLSRLLNQKVLMSFSSEADDLSQYMKYLVTLSNCGIFNYYTFYHTITLRCQRNQNEKVSDQNKNTSNKAR